MIKSNTQSYQILGNIILSKHLLVMNNYRDIVKHRKRMPLEDGTHLKMYFSLCSHTELEFRLCAVYVYQDQ